MNKFDPKNKYVMRHVFLGDNSYLSMASARNVFFILFGFTACLLGIVFTFGETGEIYHRLIGMFCFCLMVASYGVRDRISISGDVLEVSYIFDLFGVTKVLRQRQYDLSNFNRAVLRWYRGGSNSRRMADSTIHLYIESSSKSICLISFHLKENGHALLLDFVDKIEPIINLNVMDKTNYLYSFKDSGEVAKES